MDLILWRHADAVDAAEDGVPDAERPLTAKGRKQAARMAKWLDERLPEATKVLASPTLRTRQTAEALGRKFILVPELMPGGAPAHVLLAAGWPDHRRPVLVVGHQPTLGRTAGLLLLGQELDVSMRKAGVWWITTRGRKDHGDSNARLTLRSAIGPDML
jgi:phosphohistidine phosphatase